MADISNPNQLARLPQSNESGPHEIAHAISARMERQRRRSCSRRAREEGPSSPLRKEKICPIRLPSSTATYALPASCQRHHLPRPGCNMQTCCNTDRCNPNHTLPPWVLLTFTSSPRMVQNLCRTLMSKCAFGRAIAIHSKQHGNSAVEVPVTGR